MITNNSGSRFWLDEGMFETSRYTNDRERSRDDLLKMASIKRAIANFVKIVTGAPIPVKFSDKNDKSLTNGKMVIIGGQAVKEKNFDAAVGLALHEGSHCKLSDFNVNKNMPTLIPEDIYTAAIDKYLPTYPSGINVDGFKGDIRTKVVKRIAYLTNVIEDRRVDHFIYTTAPGYKAYYKAMYKKYFDAPIISDGLQSGTFRKENWKSYRFRITNITNVNRDLSALKALKKIFILFDLNNIDRLKNSTDSFNLALEIYKLIENSIPTPPAYVEPEPEKEPEKDENQVTLIGYTAKGLPNGVKFNKRTGKLTGIPEKTGEFTVVITAHMNNGEKKRKKTNLEF